ncbi:MAG: hypothetical protein AAF587_26765 [Bacteroidota bacterium]
MKRVQIQDPLEYQSVVIGIATHERIWKLCFELNQCLELALTVNEQQELPPDNEAIEENQSLFRMSPDRSKRDVFYQDLISISGQEFFLHYPPQKRLLPEIQTFAYFLHIRFEKTNTPDLAGILSSINALDLVVSAIDISHVKNIKSLFL